MEYVSKAQLNELNEEAMASTYPADLKYSKEHEWVRLEGESVAQIGITEFAQDELGDVVFVELPKIGARIAQTAKMGEIESVKAVSDLFSPVTGVVKEVNEQLVDQPELVNSDPFVAGWMIRVDLENPSELDSLLSAEEYQSQLAQSG